MARKKTITTSIRSRDELETAMGDYARNVIARDAAVAQMEIEIAAIRQKHESELAEMKIAGDALFDDLNAWSAMHPDEFSARRSIELLHGTIGFRTCPPKVAQMRGVKTEHSISALSDAGMTDLIRIKYEIDKDAILMRVASAREAGPTAYACVIRHLAECGLKIDQNEIFFVEPKREE